MKLALIKNCYTAACVLMVGITATACSSYQPKPLESTSNLPDQLPHVMARQGKLQFPALSAHPLNTSGDLDMSDLAIIAVLNNPDLKLARDDAGIAHAQAFAAGLLPDPQLSLSRDLSNSGPDSTKAFSTGISYDFGAILNHVSTKNAADSEEKKADLNVLWQECQVIAQTRLLYIRLLEQKRLMGLLEGNLNLLSERLQHSQSAAKKSLVSNDVVATDLAALQDLHRQINDLERQTSQNRHELNALLGISAEATVSLQANIAMPELDDTQILSLLASLPQRRPDLLGLEAGYQAQDQRYRAALIAQFPALNIGLTHARDSSGIYSNSVGLSLSLPILNRNRGNIAIEEATRQKLFDEYQQRINAAHSDVHKMLAEQRINARQLSEIRMAVGQLSDAENKAGTAFSHGNLDFTAYASIRNALLAKRVEEITLEQTVLEQRVAMMTLLGSDLPQAHSNENKQP